MLRGSIQRRTEQIETPGPIVYEVYVAHRVEDEKRRIRVDLTSCGEHGRDRKSLASKTSVAKIDADSSESNPGSQLQRQVLYHYVLPVGSRNRTQVVEHSSSFLIAGTREH